MTLESYQNTIYYSFNSWPCANCNRSLIIFDVIDCEKPMSNLPQVQTAYDEIQMIYVLDMMSYNYNYIRITAAIVPKCLTLMNLNLRAMDILG